MGNTQLFDDFFESEQFEQEDEMLFVDESKKPANTKKSNKKSKKGKKITLCIVAVLLVFAIIIYAAANVLLSGVNYVPLEHNWEDTVATAAPDWELAENNVRYCNVLLIGADGDLDEFVRSDTMMLVSIDRLTLKVRLVSFLRDTYVQIPDHGKNRLNAAFAYGGAELLLRTIEANYRIKIDKYMCVGFENMEDIVNGLGGVTMDITDAEANYLNKRAENGTKCLVGGTQLLNGSEALNYARIRQLDNDFGRTNRQRKLIEEIVHECVSKNPKVLCSIIKQASSYVTTNITKTELMLIGMQLAVCSIRSFDTIYLPADGEFSYQQIEGKSVIMPNLEENCKLLHSFLFGTVYE